MSGTQKKPKPNSSSITNTITSSKSKSKTGIKRIEVSKTKTATGTGTSEIKDEEINNSNSNEETVQSKGKVGQNNNKCITEVAPFHLILEFLTALVVYDYDSALRLSKIIMEYEPNNKTVQEFAPILEEIIAEDGSDSECTCSDSDETCSDEESSDYTTDDETETSEDEFVEADDLLKVSTIPKK